MGNLRSFFRTVLMKKSKASPSTECQQGLPTQDVEGTLLPVRSSTPPPLQTRESIDISGLAEQSLEQCLPLYFGAQYPRQHERNVWLDQHDRGLFICEFMSPSSITSDHANTNVVQALIVISGNGTFRIDNSRIELIYLSHDGQWYAQLAVIERGFVFGRPLRSDIPRPSQREAFIRLKHGVRKVFESLQISDSFGCVPGTLGERLQDMTEYRKARHLDHDRTPTERVEGKAAAGHSTATSIRAGTPAGPSA